MKQGCFRAVRLIVFLFLTLFLMTGMVFGTGNTHDFQSIVLEPFHGDTVKEWSFHGRTFRHEFEWGLDASRFASRINDQQFPKLTYVEAWPMQLFGTNRNNLDLRSLGIWGRFDRRGYNWIDVFPIVPGSAQPGEPPRPFEIPIPGRIRYLDMWVWGSNHHLTLEAYFRDHNGIIHMIPMGSLAYIGWQNLRIRIPNHIPQSRRVLPRHAGLYFVKFRIWTMPTERVNNFFVYFNQMKVLTDVFEMMFDGNDLADPERVRELWAQN